MFVINCANMNRWIQNPSPQFHGQRMHYTRNTKVPSRLARIRHAVSSTGWMQALRDLAQLFGLGSAPNWADDRAFDERFGTDTSGSVEVDALGFSDARVNEQAIRYLPSPDHLTRWLLRAVKLEHREFVFIDVGCGKGRVVAVASEFPFRTVIGIDLSPELVATAERNAGILARRFPERPPIKAEVADASVFAFPNQPLLVHLYHPFQSSILHKMLENLRQSVQACPRRVVVAYLLYTSAIDDVLAVFAHHPWMPLVRREGSLLGHHDWLIFDSHNAPPLPDGTCS